MEETMEKETTIEKENIEYGKFWVRTGAYITDAVILMIIVLPIIH